MVAKATSFDNIQERGERADYVKIAAGKQTRLHLYTDTLVEFYTHRPKANNKGFPERCDGPACLMCQKPAEFDRKRRYAVAVFNADAKAMQVLEQGPAVFNQIKNIWTAYNKDLNAVDLLVSKTGEGLNTVYTVVPMPTTIKPDMVKGLVRFDTLKVYGGAATSTGSAVVETEDTPSAVVEEVPF